MDKITPYLAVWGAVVSTIVALYNIYKDYIHRSRVRVTAGFQVIMPGGRNVFSVSVTNLSSQNIRVTHIAIFPHRLHRRIFIRKMLRKLGVKLSTEAFLLSFEPLAGETLPAIVEPLNTKMFVYSVENFPQIADLQVSLADGRVRYCARSAIKAIHRNSVYKHIRSEAIPPIKV